MAQAPKKQDKPTDPPYPGGEDEDMKSGPEVKEPPVDETEDGPSNAYRGYKENRQPTDDVRRS
jgi:hypothetical protein